MFNESLNLVTNLFNKAKEKGLQSSLEAMQQQVFSENTEEQSYQHKFTEAYDFFKQYTIHIEIHRDKHIYSTYFPKLPHC
jgi:hypothetical protein